MAEGGLVGWRDKMKGGNRWEIFRRQDIMVGVKTWEKEFIYQGTEGRRGDWCWWEGKDEGREDVGGGRFLVGGIK